MIQISKKDFDNKLKQIIKLKLTRDEIKKLSIAGSFFTIYKVKGFWLMDHLEMKYYKIFTKELEEIAYLHKYEGKLFIQDGFVDKSLNTAVFSDINKQSFVYENIQLEWSDIEKINQFIENKYHE